MMKIFISLLFLSGLIFLTTPTLVTAQVEKNKMQINLGKNQPPGMGIAAISNPNASVGNILGNFIKIMFIFGGLAVLVFLIWGAFDWITAGGDKEKLAGARRKIINALIGLGLLALAAFIVSLFGQIAGFDPLKTPPLPKLDAQPGAFTPATGTTP